MKVLKILGWLLLLLIALFLFAWFTGAIGSGVAHWLEKQLPYQAGKELRVDKFYYTDAIPDDDGRIFFALSLNRLEQMVDEAMPYPWLVPPGLLKDGLVVEATWVPWKRDKETREKKPMGVKIPVGIAVRDTAYDHPRITGRLPASTLTAYMAKEFERDFSEEREEWELGHYAYEFRPRVNSCLLHTTNDTAFPPERYAKNLYLKLKAQADVGMTFEENVGTFERDGSLSIQLDGTMHFAEKKDGLSPWYRAYIRVLNANIKGMNNLIDNEISDRLKEKWQTSLNKEKRRKRFAKKRVPAWFPTDLVVDVRFDSE